MEIALMAMIVFSAILYLAEPLLEDAAAVTERGVGERKDFEHSEAILDEIADLDLERAAGKIADANYNTVRSRLIAEAASALKQRAEHRSREEVTTLQISERSTCPACGTIIEPGDHFCAACGAKIGTATDAEKKETK